MTSPKSKGPMNPPVVGDRVKLRGKAASGTLTHMNDRKWARVDWDENARGPLVVHLFELEKA